MFGIGIMSGTSLDGVDISFIEVGCVNKKIKYKHLQSFTYPYTQEIKSKIMEASSLDCSNVQKICSLNFEIGYYYVKAIEVFIRQFSIDIQIIDFIAMHGQTIWHNPIKSNNYVSSTLQIGEASIVSYHFNKMVISNFRSMDIVAGGQGAPLIGFVHYQMYHSSEKNIAVQNFGGIGNVTYLKKGGSINDIIAFDTGPGNMLIDLAMNMLYNKSYDENGEIAFKGQIIEPVLADLLSDPYFNIIPPKSTGREKFSKLYLKSIINKVCQDSDNKSDIITTLAAFTAFSVIDQYQKFLKDIDQLIIVGGGSHNCYIVDLLKKHLKVPIIIPPEADDLEAIGFAILGYCTINGVANNVPNATGAKKNVVLGNVTMPPVRE